MTSPTPNGFFSRIKRRLVILILILIIPALLYLGGFQIDIPQGLFKVSKLQQEVREVTYQISATNLINNSGFEEGADGDGVPLNWTDSLTSGGEMYLDPTVKRSGGWSWCFNRTHTGGYLGALSDYIPVDPAKVYNLSVWVKSKNGDEPVWIGWNVYDENQSYITAYYFIANNKTASTNWTKFSGFFRPRYRNTRYARIRIFGTDSYAVGSVWWDDISFNELGEFLPALGCTNNESSKCIDFGETDENPSGVTYNTAAMDSGGVEDGTDYKQIKSGWKLELEFPEFNVDENGFPLTPMLLEVRYKDVVLDSVENRPSVITLHRAFVWSKIDYINPDPLVYSDKEDYSVAQLGGFNDSQWKHMHYVFEKTDFQLLREINGSFIIKMGMRSLWSGEQVNLPIDYVSLSAITDSEARVFTDYQRDIRDFYRVELPADEPSVPISYSDLVVFSRDIMRPVYNHTKPESEEIDRNISTFSALGEIEPASFSIYSENGIDNLQFEVSDLINPSNGEVIPTDNISVFKVVYDDKRLPPYGVQSKYRSYASIPDRLENFSLLSVEPNTSQRIWLKIYVPRNLSGGVYAGNVNITRNNLLQKSVKIELDVLPMELDPSKHTNYLSRDPYQKTYTSDPDEIFRLYKEVGSDLIYHPWTNDIEVIKDSNGTIVDFNTTIFELKFNRSVDADDGFTRRTAYISLWLIWRYNLYTEVFGETFDDDDPDIYEKFSSEEFVDAFSLLIQKLMQIGNANNISILFRVVDEPTDTPWKRIISDRMYTIIKDVGGEVVVTYHTDCEEPVNTSYYNLPPELGGQIPPLTDLVDYKVWNGYSQGTGYSEGYDTYGYYTTGTSYLRNPVYNRFLHGLLAFRTDADIVQAYAMGDLQNDPFNDFDSAVSLVFPFTYPDFLYAYPTWSGKMPPTMSFEGIREGIKDARYIATLKRLITENNESNIAVEAEEYLANITDNISTDYWDDYYYKSDDYGFYDIILANISEENDPEDFEAFTEIRTNIKDYITQLLSTYDCNDTDGDYYILENLSVSSCKNVCGLNNNESCTGNSDCNDANASINPGATEECDALDNDCNGQVDENLLQSCYTGYLGSQDVGICHAGNQTCTNGTWGSCVDEVTPQTEVCDDSLDNDCDGLPDLLDSECLPTDCTALPNGFSCYDGTFCNGPDQCLSNNCQSVGPIINCDDGVACTTDACNETTDRCDIIPNNASCDDDLYCNGVEYCDYLTGCVSSTAVTCNDGISCTEDSCDEATDSCTYTANDSRCSVDEVCNTTLFSTTTGCGIVLFTQTNNFTGGSTITINAAAYNITLEILTTSDVTNANVTIAKYTNNPTNTTFSMPLLDRYFQINASTFLTQNVNWTMLRAYYTDEDLNLSNLEESTLALYMFNDSISEWQKLNATAMDWVYGTDVETAPNYVWANISHLSTFAVGGESLLSSVEIALTVGWNLISIPLVV